MPVANHLRSTVAKTATVEARRGGNSCVRVSVRYGPRLSTLREARPERQSSLDKLGTTLSPVEGSKGGDAETRSNGYPLRIPALHRRLGIVGAGLAVVLIVPGSFTSTELARRGYDLSGDLHIQDKARAREDAVSRI